MSDSDESLPALLSGGKCDPNASLDLVSLPIILMGGVNKNVRWRLSLPTCFFGSHLSTELASGISSGPSFPWQAVITAWMLRLVTRGSQLSVFSSPALPSLTRIWLLCRALQRLSSPWSLLETP